MPERRILSIKLPEPWAAFLHEVDALLPAAIEVNCIGGFILAAIHNIPRRTGDLDYTAVFPADAGERLEEIAGLQSKLAKKYRVASHRVDIGDLPEDYEDRLIELDAGLKKLKLLALDAYDLVLSKLTRNSFKDREDVKFLAGKLSLEFSTLYARFEKEMKPWIPNVERHETTLRLWREYFGNGSATDTSGVPRDMSEK